MLATLGWSHLFSIESNIPSLSSSKSQPSGTPSVSVSIASSNPSHKSLISKTLSLSESHCPLLSKVYLSVEVPTVCPVLTSTLLGTPVVASTVPVSTPLPSTAPIKILSPPSSASKHPSPSESTSK